MGWFNVNGPCVVSTVVRLVDDEESKVAVGGFLLGAHEDDDQLAPFFLNQDRALC